MSKAEKYIDLGRRIADDLRKPWASTGMADVLRWLDEHPDQVPGRTITESAFLEACEYEDQTHRASSPHTYAERVMFALGVTVVPDPEPTNTEKLKDLIWDEGRVSGRRAQALAEYLDCLGVKAPGGDND